MLKKILAIIILLLTNGCNNENEIQFSRLDALPYYVDAEINGKKVKKRLRHKYYEYRLGGKPYTGIVIDYDKNTRNLKAKGPMKNGFPHGYWNYYFPDGELQMEGNFVDGNSDSIWKKYYENGKLKVIEKYTSHKDTIVCDTIGAWYSSGIALKQISGDTVKRFYKSGKLASITIGNPVREEEIYRKSGTLCSRTTNYRRDIYEMNGTCKRKVYYLWDKKGIERFFQENTYLTNQEKTDILRADSVEIDNTKEYDPLMKVYWK